MRPSDILFVHNLVIMVLCFTALFSIEAIGLWWVSTTHEKEEKTEIVENLASPKTGDVFLYPSGCKMECKFSFKIALHAPCSML